MGETANAVMRLNFDCNNTYSVLYSYIVTRSYTVGRVNNRVIDTSFQLKSESTQRHFGLCSVGVIH